MKMTTSAFTYSVAPAGKNPTPWMTKELPNTPQRLSYNNIFVVWAKHSVPIRKLIKKTEVANPLENMARIMIFQIIGCFFIRIAGKVKLKNENRFANPTKSKR